jgi:hypothetical protein
MWNSDEETFQRWEEDSLRYHGKVLKGKFWHWCGEWDGLPIDETCSEFECCYCFEDDPKVKEKDSDLA